MTLNLEGSLRIVRPQKTFPDFNEIWYVDGAGWLMHNGMLYENHSRGVDCQSHAGLIFFCLAMLFYGCFAKYYRNVVPLNLRGPCLAEQCEHFLIWPCLQMLWNTWSILVKPLLQTWLLWYCVVDNGFVRSVALLQLLLSLCPEAHLFYCNIYPRHVLHSRLDVGQVCWTTISSSSCR